MKYLALLLLLTGCAGTKWENPSYGPGNWLAERGWPVNVPVSQFDEGISEICAEGSGVHEWNGVEFNLQVTDDPVVVYDTCGSEAYACTNGYDVLVQTHRCDKSLAHEINHLVGNDWVDGYKN